MKELEKIKKILSQYEVELKGYKKALKKDEDIEEQNKIKELEGKIEEVKKWMIDFKSKDKKEEDDDSWADFGNFESSSKDKKEEDDDSWADFGNFESSSKDKKEEDDDSWADFGNFESSSKDKKEEEDDNWADFGNFESSSKDKKEEKGDNWADFDSMKVITVDIGEYEVALPSQKLFTDGLADCVAVVGYTADGDAAMYHVNIPAQCYCIAHEEDWDNYLSEIAGQYAKVKDKLEKALGKDSLSYQFVVGGTWDYVVHKPKTYKNGTKWIKMMNEMFQKTFKGAFKGCSTKATWNPKTKQLTPG